MKFRKRDWTVGIASHRDASAFIKKHHYARGTSNTSVVRTALYRAGSLWNDDIMGASLWMPAPLLAVRKHNMGPREVLTLSRLAIHPDVPTNGASYLIGWSIRHIKKNYPHIKLLMTFADDYQQHTGAIYRATNWEYCGKTRATYMWVDDTGKLVSAYCDGKKKRASEMDRLYNRIGPFAKHKFILPL